MFFSIECRTLRARAVCAAGICSTSRAVNRRVTRRTRTLAIIFNAFLIRIQFF
jgi:hypothetical protein